jgi:hypothetical protein
MSSVGLPGSHQIVLPDTDQFTTPQTRPSLALLNAKSDACLLIVPLFQGWAGRIHVDMI